ncbi:hypothetical protein ACLNGM_11775 [Aureimonas phyllosphaerae]|uniref:hypothetical protein n=1 Tax=Aureimonas phyllosphaerae TaxID=1166078 RepID=UPI003A5C45FF
MDSMPEGSGILLRFWRAVFGGSEAAGMTRLMAFLAGYILVIGLFFAFVTS